MLKWMVYRHNFNKKSIERVNVFDYCGLNSQLKSLKNKKLPFDKFKEELRSVLLYNFWSRCEYEIILTSWPPHVDAAELERINQNEKGIIHTVNLSIEEKIDIYDQIMMNFDIFAKYVWEAS